MYGFVPEHSVGTQSSFLSAADYPAILGNWWSSSQKFFVQCGHIVLLQKRHVSDIQWDV